MQAPLALQAARAGKHLLLEKPVALEVAQAEELADAVSEAGVAAVVFLTRLWSPLIAGWLEETVATGGWHSGRAAFVGALSDEALKASPWRQDHGALWDVGPHALSVLEAVLGPVVDVQAVRGHRDHVVLALRHGSGAASSTELTLTAAPGAAHTTVALWGEEGLSAPMPAIAPESAPAEVGAAVQAALTALHEAVRSGVAPDVGGLDQGVRLTRVLAQAQQCLS